MKKNIFIATVFLITSLVGQILMANENCQADAEKIAELAINAKAEKYSHSGFIDKTSTLHIRDIKTGKLHESGATQLQKWEPPDCMNGSQVFA